jgi:hypothetical protein
VNDKTAKAPTHDLKECRTLWCLWQDSIIHYRRAVSHENTMNALGPITASKLASHISTIRRPHLHSSFVTPSCLSSVVEYTTLFSLLILMYLCLFSVLISSLFFRLYLKHFLLYHISPSPSCVNTTFFCCYILPGSTIMLLSFNNRFFFLTFHLYSSITTLFIHISFTLFLPDSRFQCFYCAV